MINPGFVQIGKEQGVRPLIAFGIGLAEADRAVVGAAEDLDQAVAVVEILAHGLLDQIRRCRPRCGAACSALGGEIEGRRGRCRRR